MSSDSSNLGWSQWGVGNRSPFAERRSPRAPWETVAERTAMQVQSALNRACKATVSQRDVIETTPRRRGGVLHVRPHALSPNSRDFVLVIDPILLIIFGAQRGNV